MHHKSSEIDWKCCGYVRKLFGDDSQWIHKRTPHESMVWEMRFRTPDGTLPFAVFDCSNGVFIVADKYEIQIQHLVERGFSFQKHQKYRKSNDWARRNSNRRTEYFFIIIKKYPRTRHVIRPAARGSVFRITFSRPNGESRSPVGYIGPTEYLGVISAQGCSINGYCER